MKTNTSFRGAQSFVVLNPKAFKNLNRTIIHVDREGNIEFSHRHFQEHFDIRREFKACSTGAQVLLNVFKELGARTQSYPPFKIMGSRKLNTCWKLAL